MHGSPNSPPSTASTRPLPSVCSAEVAELVDAADSKSACPRGRVGSSPTSALTRASTVAAEGRLCRPRGQMRTTHAQRKQEGARRGDHGSPRRRGGLKIRCPARACGFKSHLRHLTPCIDCCGRRPALPAERPDADNPCAAQAGGGSWGNRPRFPHAETRRTQNPLPARACGFKSHLRHSALALACVRAGVEQTRIGHTRIGRLSRWRGLSRPERGDPRGRAPRDGPRSRHRGSSRGMARARRRDLRAARAA